MDYAIIEATAITEDGGIVPTTSVGNSASFASLASKVIIELNLDHAAELEGLHDIYIPTRRPTREPIPVVSCDRRIGLRSVNVVPAKIATIVVTRQSNSPAMLDLPDVDMNAIASHLLDFSSARLPREGWT